MAATRPLAALATVCAVLALAGCTAAGTRPSLSATASETAAVQPTPTPTTDPVADAVAAMTTAEQAASVVMGHIPTTDTDSLSAYMSAGYGGFILMGANIGGSPEAVRAVTDALTSDASVPPLIAIDQEGGIVSRLPWDRGASPSQLQTLPVEDTRETFAARAALVAEAGANVNFGIVADVPQNASSFIACALGTDPAASAARVAAAVDAERDRVASTIKHFPGHGAAPGDSHRSIPSTDMSMDAWRDADAVPFVAGIDAGAELVMFGHLAYTAVDTAPASLSPRWHEIARQELGFDGVMITDDLGMLTASGVGAYRDPVTNAVSALVAGNDMVLMVAGSTPDTARQMADGITQAVSDGVLPAERLREAAERVMALRMDLATRG